MLNVASRRLVHSTLELERFNVDEWELDFKAVFARKRDRRAVRAC